MSRRRRQLEKLAAPVTDYSDAEDNALRLRGSLTAGSRAEYERIVGGGLDREDAWQRGVEFLFEHLAVSWTIAGLELTRQKELLGRYRLASNDERRFVRDSLRRHLQENFPELVAP